MRRRSVAGELPLRSFSSQDSYFQDTIATKHRKTNSNNKLCILLVIALLTVGAIYRYVFRGEGTKYDYGRDTLPNCDALAKAGECSTSRVEMLAACPHSCHKAGITIESLSEQEHLQDARLGFAHILHSGDAPDVSCKDTDPLCEQWAQEGQCLENAKYMIRNCPVSCLVCFGPHPRTVTIDFGVEQQVKDDETWKILEQTRGYMANEVFMAKEDRAIRRDCRNLDPQCSIYAALGECHGRNDAVQMFLNCAPACQACHAVEYYRRCQRDPERDVEAVSDLDDVFERIIDEYPQYKPIAVSHPDDADDYDDDELEYPFILQLDDFLTQEECDWLIAQGYDIGFDETSVISSEVQEDGHFAKDNGEVRTSTDAWCNEGCEDTPIGKRLMDRMTNLTGIPQSHTEFLELLKYDTGAYFKEHHDLIETQGQERCGNRILTLYLFLNDVEEGGELAFTEMEKVITPKRGRAVLWPSVVNDDFDEMQEYTFHEARPVIRGKKYGANLWFHPYNVREALEAGCCQ